MKVSPVETENGTWQAKYVIAADGARSVVRQSVGIKFEGPRTSDAFIVVDVKEDERKSTSSGTYFPLSTSRCWVDVM